MKKFVCYWGDGYENHGAAEHTSDFFCEDNCYEPEDIFDINALDVGEVWQTLVFPEGKQFVLRVE